MLLVHHERGIDLVRHTHPRRSILTAHFCLSTVRTPATAAYLKDYRRRLPSSYNVVKEGGWFALEQAATKELAAKNFSMLKPNLPKDLDIVKAGGWDTVEQLAADPKGALMQLVKASATGTTSSITSDHLDAIVALLQAQGKGFSSELVDGEWALVLQRQAKKSPKVQKLVGKSERPGTSYSNFDTSKMEFYGTVKLLKYGQLSSTVKYRPVADGFEGGRSSIVLRRIACDIVGAGWKFGRLPRLPIPLKKKGGYLDFIFLDKDLRVTRGNRGGFFVHARPETLKELLA